MSSLRRDHANLLCIVPILTDVPERVRGEIAQALQGCPQMVRLVGGEGRRHSSAEQAREEEVCAQSAFRIRRGRGQGGDHDFLK